MRNFGRMPRRITVKATEKELGFGKTITTANRLMNPDGTFNVERQRVGIWDNTYFNLVTMPWRFFFAFVLGAFILMNSLFSFMYCAIGIEHLNGTTPGSFLDNFTQAYFFSSQTLTTVGYGHISPKGLSANILASLESFLGLISFALVSGLLYGRFSRQRAKIVFSENLIVAPYREGRALMFRMGNARRSEILEAEVQVMLAINQRGEGDAVERKFYNLPLEINRVAFFSLSWTVVHALDDKSPVAGFTEADLQEAAAEFMVMVKGIDEANHQTVNARRSYNWEEMVWNARFSPVVSRNEKGQPYVMMQKIGEYSLV
jgi:inward rectifier potassium channel